MTIATPLQPGSLVTYTRVPDEEGNHLDPETMAAYVEGLGPLIYLGPSPDPQIAEDGIGRVWVPEMGTPGRYRGAARRSRTRPAAHRTPRPNPAL